jgi:hypothetical protein
MDKFLPKLPDSFYPENGDDVPRQLIGAKIVFWGTIAEPMAADGGGLVIEFIPEGGTTKKRIVFAFNERGMWIDEKRSDDLSIPDEVTEEACE